MVPVARKVTHHQTSDPAGSLGAAVRKKRRSGCKALWVIWSCQYYLVRSVAKTQVAIGIIRCMLRPNRGRLRFCYAVCSSIRRMKTNCSRATGAVAFALIPHDFLHHVIEERICNEGRLLAQLVVAACPDPWSFGHCGSFLHLFVRTGERFERTRYFHRSGGSSATMRPADLGA